MPEGQQHSERVLQAAGGALISYEGAVLVLAGSRAPREQVFGLVRVPRLRCANPE